MNLLVLLLVVPLIGAAVTTLLPSGRAARLWALAVSLLTLAVTCIIALRFDYSSAAVQMAAGRGWQLTLEHTAISLSVGIDSISLLLVALTAFLQPLAIASSFSSIDSREKEYYGWMLLLLFAMLGVFVARDLVLFYVFFELTLVPMFFIIGVWGGPQRRYAAGKFFLFTFAGSVLTLAAVVYLGLRAGSFDLGRAVAFAQTGLTAAERWWIVLGLLAGFSIKVPLFPVHTWLPLAHTEAPTAGSVILAGVLLKLGTYGLLRLAVPIGLIDARGVAFPALLGWIGVVCVIGVIYGALCAWVQQDIKKLVAYSSVSHLGFCVLGLAALNEIGLQGSVLYMINHGLSTGALFLVVGMIYERQHTRDINELSGLARRMPVLGFFFVLFALSSIGLPGLNGFVSEFLTVLGAFTSRHLGVIGFGVAAALGVILGAVYMLHMVARVIFGPLKVPHEGPGDLNGREISILVPLALAVVLLGVYPRPVLESIRGPVRQILGSASARADSCQLPVAGCGVACGDPRPVQGEER